MPVTIKEVRTKGDYRKFIRFPYKVFKGNDCWVPPLEFDEMNTLRPDVNPAFEYCEAAYFLAYKDGKLSGRVAGIVNKRANEKWGNKCARFGWLDFFDDVEVSRALLDAVAAWAKAKGLDALNGPLGFTDLDKEGLLVEGHDQLSTMAMLYTPAYYQKHLEDYGFRKDIDWVEYFVSCPKEIPEKVRRVQELVLKRSGLRLLEVKSVKRDVLPYGKQMFDLINVAYEKLYGTVLLSDRQIDAYIKQYISFLKPKFSKFVIDGEGKLAGFGIVLPSLARAFQKARGHLFPFGFIHILRALAKPKVLDLYLIAVKPELMAKGIPAIMMSSIIQSAIDAGVVGAETNAELETNVEVQGLWKTFEHRQHKRRRAYIKAI